MVVDSFQNSFCCISSLSHFTSIQPQYEKSLRRFSATSTSFHVVIVKVAKVKSTRFCVVSAYLSGQNIKVEAYCALKRGTSFY